MDLNPIIPGPGGTSPARTAAGGGAAYEAADAFVRTMRDAEAKAQGGLSGGADPHALVTALAESRLAVDTVVTIRDRVVEAYQEILRMPV